MYETNIVHPDGGIVAREAACDAEGLRPLHWAELVARLGAARDFRRVMGGRLLAGGSSFNLASARHLAGLGEGKPGINPFALANGKIADAKDFAEMSENSAGDRGR
ncbi:MAG: hypothetical protein J7496_13045 [Novosphingobium sp.]|nr:hypothetical protein [Novosphingobium sp.]MBO9603423.1 hypothetical protein [Novosphingobium sp.]